MNLRRQLATSLLLLLIVLVTAVAGYRLLGGPGVTLLDAVYMAVVTIATVGYEEVVSTAHNPSLRIFNMFVILFGIGVMLYVFSAATAFIVEGELKDIFRRRTMLKQIAALADHFIVCGATDTAYHVVDELIKTGSKLVVIDLSEAELEKISHGDRFPVLAGDCTEEETLEAAGITRARGLVTVLPDDKDNLMVTVTARQMNPRLRIVARCTDARTANKLTRAGATSAVSPNMIGGLRLASELVRPHVVNFLDAMLKEQGKTVRVEEISIAPGSTWAGKTIRDIGIHQEYDVLALARRAAGGEMFYNPRGGTELAAGDVLIVMGELDGISRARESAGSKSPASRG
jgi:voltage-gated potassium channel